MSADDLPRVPMCRCAYVFVDHLEPSVEPKRGPVPDMTPLDWLRFASWPLPLRSDVYDECEDGGAP